MKSLVGRRQRRKAIRVAAPEASGLSRPRTRWTKLGREATIALPMILGLGLLGLGVPRTVAAWASLEAMPALEKISAGQSPTPSELAVGAAGLTLALKWAPSNRRLANLAAIEVSQALLLEPGDARRAALLADAEQHLVEGLLRNPAAATDWLTLAQVRMFRGEGGRQIAEALVESLNMGPNARLLWKPRLAMLLRYWRFLEEPEFRALRGHLRTLWSNSEADRASLLETALTEGQLRVVAAAVGEDSLSVEVFERMMAELRPGIDQPGKHK